MLIYNFASATFWFSMTDPMTFSPFAPLADLRGAPTEPCLAPGAPPAGVTPGAAGGNGAALPAVASPFEKAIIALG